ncbi:MAG: hypothetical protein H0V76_02505 [Blastocatellia bacterium]|nr:hypothetical protein [Blastocatellia bacterium]
MAKPKFIIGTSLLSLTTGSLAIAPVVMSENGYVGSIVFLPVLIVVLIVAALTFLVGIVVLATWRELGPYILLFAMLLPIGFFTGAMISKHLEIGAYKVEPTRPVVPAISNKVLSKKEATHDEVQRFWTEIVGYPTGKASRWSRPGVQAVLGALTAEIARQSF